MRVEIYREESELPLPTLRPTDRDRRIDVLLTPSQIVSDMSKKNLQRLSLWLYFSFPLITEYDRRYHRRSLD
jgi:hypothetical protein